MKLSLAQPLWLPAIVLAGVIAVIGSGLQTNNFALDAAVQTARAGAQGPGFAVVAGPRLVGGGASTMPQMVEPLRERSVRLTALGGRFRLAPG